MDNAASPEIPFNTAINPNPQPPPKSTDHSFLILGIILLVTTILTGVFLFWQLRPGRDQNQAPSKSTKIVTNPHPSIPTAKTTSKKIAYVNDDTLWVIDPDGLNKIRITDEPTLHALDWSGGAAGVKGSFMQLAWKDSSNISYLFCTRSCAIFTSNVFTKKTTIEVDPDRIYPEGPIQTLAFGWDHQAKNLAYIYVVNGVGNQMRMDMQTGSNRNTIKTFAVPNVGTGSHKNSLDDDVSIHYSPDDKYILVTNTLGQPNNVDQNTIWVFDTGGNEVLAIKSSTTSMATQARWFLRDRFLYKLANNLYYRSLDGLQNLGASINNFQNTVVLTSADGSRPIYWVNTSNLPFIEMIDATKPKKVIDSYYRPEVVDETHIIAFKAQKTPTKQKSLMSFTSAGLGIIDINTNQDSVLDTGDINLLTISP